ncbi:MAG TPA: hypothetical protein VM681_05895, partial [Candidatus Thermoplasmatota archaeon]|nr:hypothetical protein [Candidatus Thermoplasmatota archaeon]
FSTVRGLANTDLANGVVTWNVAVVGGQNFHLDATCCGADFDVTFTTGPYVNGVGNEGGSVPGAGAGHATVILFFGPPASSFVFHAGH